MNKIIIAIALSLFINSTAISEQKDKSGHNINLTPELTELLRAEMRALQADVQKLPVHIAAGDWLSVANIGANLNASYIMKQKLTDEQKHELHSVLPAHFKKLDSGFHVRASKLETAAKNHDAELVTFHFYKLIEACTTCHAEYATRAFPGFVSAENGKEHSH